MRRGVWQDVPGMSGGEMSIFYVTISHPNHPDQEMEITAENPAKASRRAIAAALAEGLKYPRVSGVREAA